MKEEGEKKGMGLHTSLESFQRIIKQSGPAASASYGLITSILLFTYIGWYIDDRNHSSPIGIICGIFIGIIIGFYHLIKVMRSQKH
ncbi:MAG: AtpZ/AtpI family protein [Candidatus Marinimicrobia bacterium]|jgi:F0F1-type ATP synthase assembly protein I|nr:AtpZ/AtpI family protein [Candidatus Neomarinimicrobiota bacterium]|tara:strand:- start:205 stop:462 length:258 start_codon:yes stop_codon:yes gene_type:complete